MQLTHSKLPTGPVCWRLALPFALAMLGCDSVPDSAPLHTLARDELIGLCDDLEDELSAPYIIECADGWTGDLVPPSDLTCRDLDLSDCIATAGDLRACHRAAHADPCAALHAVPDACVPLWRRGCMPSLMASPAIGSCPGATADVLSTFAGIYEMVRHTENPSSCSVEGEPVVSPVAQPLLLVTGTVNLAGAAVIVVEACSDPTACRRRNQEIRDGSFYASSPDRLARSLPCDLGVVGAIQGRIHDAKYHDGPSCTGSLIETTATLPSAGMLRLEERTKQWNTFEELGDCLFRFDAPPVRAAECSALEVYEARLLSEI